TQAVLLATFIMGRRNTAALSAALDAFAHALREVATREALLDEAQAHLESVLVARAGPATGTTVGAWRLGGLLGRGGMGEVYEAQHVERDERAAVKLLPAQALEDPELVERVRREGVALTKIAHPNVVRLLE